jgi:hypothetical protein
MVPIWNISPRSRRVALILTAGVAGLWVSAGLGTAQEQPEFDFQNRFSGHPVLPIFTQPQNRFGGALTSGSAWSAPGSAPSPLDPAPLGPLNPALSRVQPTNREIGSDAGPESAVVGTDPDPASSVDETASASKRETSARPGQRRDKPLRRSAADRRERRPGAIARGEADGPGGTPVQAASRRDSRAAGARIRARAATGRSAEAGQLPSVLRLEDPPAPHPRDSLGTR